MNTVVKYSLLSVVGFLVVNTGAKLAHNWANGLSSTKDYADVTVMVTRLDGQSGGTGVVISHSPTESLILTNGHVCEVARYGGIVRSDSQTGTVASFKVSQAHDLCLISTKTDFHSSASLASSSPNLYDESIVSGHPSLLPTILNRGHFSHKTVINVLTGMRDCTKEDFENGLGLYCLFLGGIPIVKSYEAQVISNLILPGNSGSAVYNASGEISGLVFAGSSGLNYAFIVPFEYVDYFIHTELPHLEVQTPKNLDLSEMKQKESVNVSNLKEKCRNITTTSSLITTFCKNLRSDMIYTY